MKNQELENALVDLINIFVDAKDFAISQAPEVIQQLLAYSLVYAIIVVCCFPIVAYLSYKFTFVWTDQETDERCDDWKGGKIASCVIGVIGSGICFIAACINFMVVLKILIAPKVFLIEYAANLI